METESGNNTRSRRSRQPSVLMGESKTVADDEYRNVAVGAPPSPHVYKGINASKIPRGERRVLLRMLNGGCGVQKKKEILVR